jgi:photosystem II stability/assembly factor-like uncharacterized protein
MNPIVLLCTLSLLCIGSSECDLTAIPLNAKSSKIALPTNGESENQAARDQWIKAMHRSAPGVNWQLLEYRNQQQWQQSKLNTRSTCGETTFANGKITGIWKERGSRNQAGSILDVNYLPATDEIWAISAGGTLWKRHRQINNWQIIRQDLRFNRGFLEFTNGPSDKRLLAFINNWLHYSANFGGTWTGTNEAKRVDQYAGYFAHPVLSEGPKGVIAYLSKPSYYSNIQLLISLDGGTTVQPMGVFETFKFDDFKLLSLPEQDEIWLSRKHKDGQVKIYRLDLVQKRLVLLNTQNSLLAGDGALEVQISQVDQKVQLFFIQHNRDKELTQLLKSTDNGNRWDTISTLPIMPWESTYHLTHQNPDIQYLGGVNAYRSKDGGKKWEPINEWWQYYDNIERFLHADIMDVATFKTIDNQAFTLISHHGGLSISYDHFKTQKNLGLSQLNVSQYYSVRTSPIDPQLIYAGSQDQGLQATFATEADSILDFEQIISGDYGHLSYTKDGVSLWAAYPGGSIYYVEDVYQGFVKTNYQLEAENETVWLSPIHASPFNGEKAVYMAGGNPDGGPGSYLIKLSYEKDKIKAKRGATNFLDEAVDGTISALEISMTDSNHWYLATTNGRFFYSHDVGQSWNQTLEFLPSGNYLYGQAIEASKINPKEVYLGGSGYSNPAVFFSDDGGRTFVDINQGLPPTLVYDLALNDKETLLFAATEAGPHVYVLEDQRWYALANACTPNQTYWSVEYVAADQLVRFGTYGRGIWDFQIEGLVLTAVRDQTTISPLPVYPNPSRDIFNLVLDKKTQYTLLNVEGQVLRKGQFPAGQQQVDLSNFPNGTYFLQLHFSDRIQMGRLVLIR